MKARVNTFLNVRTGIPEILPDNNPNDAFLKPNDVVEIVETIVGEEYKGNDVWHKLDTGIFISNFGVDMDQNLFFTKNEPLSINNDLSKKIKLNNRIGKNGRGIVIGVLDSGVDVRHSAIKAALESEEDLLTITHSPEIGNKHGTMVSGILVGNDDKISGLSIDAKIKSYRVVRDNNESTDEFGLKNALDKIANQNISIDILNLSLDIDPDSVFIFQPIINKIFNKGILITVAANEGSINNITGIAGLENVIAVGVFTDAEFPAVKANGFPKKIQVAYLNVPIQTIGIFTTLDGHSPFSSSSAYTALTTGVIADFLSSKYIPKEKRHDEVKKYLNDCSFNIAQENQSTQLKPYKHE